MSRRFNSCLIGLITKLGELLKPQTTFSREELRNEVNNAGVQSYIICYNNKSAKKVEAIRV